MLQMQGRQWDYLSDSVKDLVQQMLELDPDKRITVEDAIQHPWIMEKGCAPKTHLHDSVEEMKKFNARRKLKVSASRDASHVTCATSRNVTCATLVTQQLTSH